MSPPCLSRMGRWYRRHEGFLLGVGGLAGLGSAWELAARMGAIDQVVLASPSRVGEALARQWRSGELAADLLTSGAAFALAFALALVVGTALGLLIGLARDVESTLLPLVWFLYSAPLVVFQPLLMVWLGFGFRPVVALAASLAALPITVNTHAAVRAPDPTLLRVIRAFGGRRRDELVKVVLPAALPLVLAGFRIGAGRALVGIVVGEMFGANAGLGYRLAFYGARLRAPDVLAPVLLVMALGLLATQGIRLLEGRSRRARGA